MLARIEKDSGGLVAGVENSNFNELCRLYSWNREG